MKNKLAKILVLLMIATLLLQSNIALAAEDDITVESVTAQLEAIDTLQQMQDKRDNYKVSTGHYDTLTTDQNVINNHNETRTAYENYLEQIEFFRKKVEALDKKLGAKEK